MAYQIGEFQHERDSNTASSVFNHAFATQILDALKNKGFEKVYTYLYESSFPQLTEKTSPKLFYSLDKVCELFGLKKRPKIFVMRSYEEMVSLRGVSNPFIIFSSEYLKKLDDETLLGILAGQVAGILCKHHIIFYMMWGLDFASEFIPAGSLVVAPIINEWKRNRFFTYDRAFALATNNRVLSLRQVLINTLPRNILDRMNVGADQDVFIAQANRFVNEMDSKQSRIKDVVSMFSEKNWLPERYTELEKFFDERRL